MAAAIMVVGGIGYMLGSGMRNAPSEDFPNASLAQNTKASSGRGDGAMDDSQRRASRDESVASSPKASKARLEAIMSNENAVERYTALIAMLEKLGPEEFAALLDQFRELELTDERRTEYELMLSAWANIDPQGALAYAKTKSLDEASFDTLLGAWASYDSAAALQWANANAPTDGSENPYYAGIIRSLAAADFNAASNLLSSMSKSVARGNALDALLPHLLRQGPAATKQWIDLLTDPALKNGAIERAAPLLAAKDRENTIQFLVANPSEATNRTIDNVYSQFADGQPTEAIASFEKLPTGEARQHALRGILTTQTRQSPELAQQTMQRYASDLNDYTVQQVVWNTMRQDIRVAAGNIQFMRDEGQRNRMYGRVLRRWMEQSPAEAQEFMRTTPLPERVLRRFSNQN